MVIAYYQISSYYLSSTKWYFFSFSLGASLVGVSVLGEDEWGVVYDQLVWKGVVKWSCFHSAETVFCTVSISTSAGCSPKGENWNICTFLNISFKIGYKLEDGTETDWCEILVSGKECSAIAEKVWGLFPRKSTWQRCNSGKEAWNFSAMEIISRILRDIL